MQKSKIGRPSRWQNQPTAMYRMPVAIADEVLKVAQCFDAGEEVIFASKLQESIDFCIKTLQPSDRRFARRIFKRLMERIKMHTNGAIVNTSEQETGIRTKENSLD